MQTDTLPLDGLSGLLAVSEQFYAQFIPAEAPHSPLLTSFHRHLSTPSVSFSAPSPQAAVSQATSAPAPFRQSQRVLRLEHWYVYPSLSFTSSNTISITLY